MKPHIGSIIRLQATLSQITDQFSIKCTDIKILDILFSQVNDITMGNSPFSFGAKKCVLLAPCKGRFAHQTVVIAIVIFHIAIRKIQRKMPLSRVLHDRTDALGIDSFRESKYLVSLDASICSQICNRRQEIRCFIT